MRRQGGYAKAAAEACAAAELLAAARRTCGPSEALAVVFLQATAIFQSGDRGLATSEHQCASCGRWQVFGRLMDLLRKIK